MVESHEPDSLGGRRFFLALLACVSSTILVTIGTIDDSAYATIQITVVAAYITGNVAQKISEAINGSTKS